MQKEKKPGFTTIDHVLIAIGTLLVGLGAVLVYGAAPMGWVMIVAGFALSAGVSARVILRARRGG
jgi:hypothetical protein